MEWISLISFFLAIVAIVVSLLVVWRGRQLHRPALKLHIGYLFGRNAMPRKYRRDPKRTLIVGAGKKFRYGNNIFANIPVVIENPTPLPATNVLLELRFPPAFLLDNSTLIDSHGTSGVSIQLAETAHHMERTVLKTKDLVFVRFEIPIIRPKEKLAMGELIVLPELKSKSFRNNTYENSLLGRLYERFEKSPAFKGACIINAEVRSAHCEPQLTELYVLAFGCEKLADLGDSFSQALKSVWDNRMKDGVYFNPVGVRWLRKFFKQPNLSNPELAEMSINPDLDFPFDSEALNELFFDSERLIVGFDLPPWGFAEESRPVEDYVGRIYPIDKPPFSFLYRLRFGARSRRNK